MFCIVQFTDRLVERLSESFDCLCAGLELVSGCAESAHRSFGDALRPLDAFSCRIHSALCLLAPFACVSLVPLGAKVGHRRVGTLTALTRPPRSRLPRW
ncbi:MAG: hypothetical protein WKF73_10895 [Nocardioidaceae bacterium]